jgi:hypothetical protein
MQVRIWAQLFTSCPLQYRYHEPRSRDERQVIHLRPCVVLQRTTTDVDVAKQLGGAPTMGNLTERFSVLVLVPLGGENPEPQQFFAGQRFDVKCVCPLTLLLEAFPSLVLCFLPFFPMLFPFLSEAFPFLSRLLHEAQVARFHVRTA